MSFGFSIGDFIAILEHTNKVRKKFAEAPAQFVAISNEVRNFSFVIQDVEVDLSSKDLNNRQKAELLQIAKSCHSVLLDIDKMIDCYRELKPDGDLKRNTVKRVWKRLQWEPTDVRDLRNRLTSNIALLNAFNSNITQRTLMKLVRQQDSQEREMILNWLSPDTYETKQSDYISRHQPGTGQWFLKSPELQAWLGKPGQTVFCPGIPGAGKTIFTSILIEELHSLYGNISDVGIAFIYCDLQNYERQEPEHLLASILRQLAQSQPSLPVNLQTLFDQCKIKRLRPTVDEICNAMHVLLPCFSQTFIVLDALDECLSCDRSRARVLDEIFNLQSQHKINFLATSRLIPDVAAKFEGEPWLEICASKPDVEAYVRFNLKKLPSFVSRNPDLQHEITTKIADAADGMFLLAQLRLDSLVGKRSIKAIRSALMDLSTGSKTYDSAYNDAMQRIEGQVSDQRDLAKQVLSWITCARRELTTTELQTALAVEIGEPDFDEDGLPDIADMVSVCAGLVTVDEQSHVIRLIHSTAQEYFKRTWSNWFPSAHHEITTTCVTYLCFDSFSPGACPTDKDFEARLKTYPLFAYAAGNWGHHARMQSIPDNLVISLIGDKMKLEASVQALFAQNCLPTYPGHSQQAPKQMTGLHLAACFGLESITQQLIQSGYQVDIKDSFGRTPLSWAAGNDHKPVVQLLLDMGADPDSRDSHNRSPLSRTAFSRHGKYRAFTPESSGDHEDVVKLLLQRGADPESRDEHGRTPLSWAALNGDEVLVKLLLGVGANSCSVGEDGRTPLSRAALNGHEAVVRDLLGKGADPDIIDRHGRTPLSCAAANGHAAMVKFLFQKGANPDCKDEDGRTPLLRAAYCGHQTVVKVLLEIGADPDSRDGDGRTPLSRAMSAGHHTMTNLLLEVGADPDSRDDNGRSPLSWAASGGREELVKNLLEVGVSPDSRDGYGRTPLSWAASSGWEAIVNVLLGVDAIDPDLEDNQARTPLSWAASSGHEKTVRALLDKGVDPESRDKDGRTPLSWAASAGHDVVVKLLLEYNAVNPDSKDEQSRTPLLWAALHGREAVLKLLIEARVNLNSKDEDGWSPLSLAAHFGHDTVVALLEGKGVHLDLEEKETGEFGFIVRVDRQDGNPFRYDPLPEVCYSI